MQLSNIDRNFHIPGAVTEKDVLWIPLPDPRVSIYGLYAPDRGEFCRMCPQTAARVSEGVAQLARHTSGGRLRFYTDSPYIAIRAGMHAEKPMPHFTLCGQSGFDLYKKEEDGYIYRKTFLPPVGMTDGYESLQPAGEGEWMIHFPLYDSPRALWLGVRAGATLRPGTPYRHTLPAVFYGSSITQGGCASRPGNTYAAILSRMLDTDFVDLGFSGCAKGEEAMAQYIAGLKMSVFVMDYDHNAPDAEYLAKTHRPFFEIFRAAQPKTPVICLSRPDFEADAACPARREVIRRTVEQARAQGDENVYFIDGETLFGRDGRDGCTVDGTHPNDLGFWRMAQAVAPVLAPLLK